MRSDGVPDMDGSYELRRDTGHQHLTDDLHTAPSTPLPNLAPPHAQRHPARLCKSKTFEKWHFKSNRIFDIEANPKINNLKSHLNFGSYLAIL